MISQTGILFTAQQFIIAVSQTGMGKNPALTTESSWGDVFGFLFLGLAIVISTLASLCIFCAIIGFFFKRIESAKHVREEAGKSQKIASPGADAVDESHIPVIAAAVAVILENHHYRITRIASARRMEQWAQEGRRQIFAAHTYVRYH